MENEKYKIIKFDEDIFNLMEVLNECISLNCKRQEIIIPSLAQLLIIYARNDKNLNKDLFFRNLWRIWDLTKENENGITKNT